MKKTNGTGNIFADLGLDDAHELHMRSSLACEILEAMKNRGWTQNKMAEHLGTQQSEISALKRGDMERFSLDRLLKYTLMLNRDIDIVVKRKGKNAKVGNMNFIQQIA